MSENKTEILENIISGLPLSRMEYLKDEYFSGTNLKELLKNEELLKTIAAFLKNDLNVLKTSKQTFMHRNTLLYRLQKIKKLVGLDIRHFEDALTMKILLKLHEIEKKSL